MNYAVKPPFPRFYRVCVLLFERVDEIGDGVALRVGPESLLVVLDVRRGLRLELIHDVLGGHAVRNDHHVQDFVEHVRRLEALAEQVLRAHLRVRVSKREGHGGEELQRGHGQVLVLQRGVGRAERGEQFPDGGREGLEVENEEFGVEFHAASLSEGGNEETWCRS